MRHYIIIEKKKKNIQPNTKHNRMYTEILYYPYSYNILLICSTYTLSKYM